MKLIHFNNCNTTDLNEFITFWSKLYSYSNEHLYNDTIIKREYDIDNFQKLFVWKNGMKLSGLKQKSLDIKIIAKLSIINTLKSNEEVDLDFFKKEFKNLSAVWKIFLLHTIKPKTYPIYDQHIHRAYNYIHNLDYSNISSEMSNKIKEEFYFNTYYPFIQKQKQNNLKRLDEAFFAFGQFLNTRNYATLLK